MTNCVNKDCVEYYSKGNFTTVAFMEFNDKGDFVTLIPQTYQKKEPAIDLEIINAQWKVYEDGEQFNLIVNGEDISDRVIIELAENNDMIIFDSETSCYFLLNDLDSVSENELQEVKGYISSHGIAIIRLVQTPQD